MGYFLLQTQEPCIMGDFVIICKMAICSMDLAWVAGGISALMMCSVGGA